jgi:uncharacterized damage-inducible protein DinB
MPEPRRLQLATLDSVIAEVERLHKDGYDRAGNWNLSQICEHLADWATYPMDGFPPTPFAIKLLLGAMRTFSGKKMLNDFISSQSMKANSPTMSQSVHPADGNEAESVMRFKAVIQRLTEHRGEIHPSPLFGKLNRAELISLQLAHCVHHLNFLIPKVST